MNPLLELLSLSTEDIHISQTAIFVIDDTHASHDRDGVVVDGGDGGEPPADYGDVGLAEDKSSSGSGAIRTLKLLVVADWLLAIILTKEDID